MAHAKSTKLKTLLLTSAAIYLGAGQEANGFCGQTAEIDTLYSCFGSSVGFVDSGGNDTMTNTGTITGVVDLGTGGDSVDNAGVILGSLISGAGNDEVTNSGTISATGISTALFNTADDLIFINTTTGVVENTTSTSRYAFYHASSGNSSVTNDGLITTNGNTSVGVTVPGEIAYGYFTGSGSDNNTLNNNGTIHGESLAMHFRGSGAQSINNTGSIKSNNTAAIAYSGSSFIINNSGTIEAGNNTAYSSTFNTGYAITEAIWGPVGSNDTIINSGSISGNIGVYDGDDIITNSGAGNINGTVHTGDGNDTVTNDGTIQNGIRFASGVDHLVNNNLITSTGEVVNSVGVFNVVNNGTISNVGLSVGSDALNTQSSVNVGVSTITNNGLIEGTRHGFSSTGGKDTGFDFTNNGTITGASQAITFSSASVDLTEVNINDTLTNNGVINGNVSTSIGNDVITNSIGGSITGNINTGIGFDTISNDGIILGGALFGGTTETSVLNNTGTIDENGTGNSTVSVLDDYTVSFNNTANINNSGLIVNQNALSAILLNAEDGQTSTINNSGTIRGDRGAIGNVGGSYSNVIITNSGLIEGNGAINTPSIGFAHSFNHLMADSINNSGTIFASYDRAIQTQEGNDTVVNSGNITGQIRLGSENDILTNTSTGNIDSLIGMGDGDDTIINAGNINFNQFIIGGAGIDTFEVIGHTGGLDTSQILQFENLNISANSNFNATANLSFTNTINVDTTSTLMVDNVTTGTLNNAGTLSSNSGGNIEIIGNLANTGVLNLILDSNDTNSTSTSGVVSAVVASGNVTLASGSTINVSNAVGSDIANFITGEVFDVITANSIIDNGTNIVSPTLPNNLVWAGSVNGNIYQLTLNATQLNCNGASANNIETCRVLNGQPNLSAVQVTALLNAATNDTDVLNKLNPEPYLAMAHLLQDADTNFTGTLRERLGELRTMRRNLHDETECGMFTRGFGNTAESADDNTGLYGYKSDNIGASVGGDCKLDSNITVGIAAGYSKGKLGHDIPFKGKQDVYQGALYANYADSAYHVDGIISYGNADITTRRDANIAGLGGLALAEYKSKILSARLETGADISSGQIEVEPWLGLQYQHVQTDEFNEHGAKSLSLQVQEHKTDRLAARAGLNFRKELTSGDQTIRFIPELRVHYQRDLMAEDNGLDYSLAGTNAHANGIERARDKAVIGVGFTSHIDNIMTIEGDHSLYGSYSYEMGLDQDANNHSVSGGYKFNF